MPHLPPKRFRRYLATGLTIGFMVLLGCLIFWLLSLLLWNGTTWRAWTGFGEYTSPKGEYQRAKTLWDWMQLLIVPAVLAIAVWYLNKAQSDRESLAALKQATHELEIATDQQRQAMLEAYLDKMTDLLLQFKLREAQEKEEVRTIARARTLSVLRTMDGGRRGYVVKFLYETNLITPQTILLDLSNADLRGAHLAWSLLEGVVLIKANLEEADLKWTHLEQANLEGASLVGTDLQGAYLNKAILRKCNLADAVLQTADLQSAQLQYSSLARANLQKANLTGANLEHTYLVGTDFSGATLNNTRFAGSKYSNLTRWPQAIDPVSLKMINIDLDPSQDRFSLE